MTGLYPLPERKPFREAPVLHIEAEVARAEDSDRG